jgi:hypothetical protein
MASSMGCAQLVRRATIALAAVGSFLVMWHAGMFQEKMGKACETQHEHEYQMLLLHQYPRYHDYKCFTRANKIRNRKQWTQKHTTR